MELQLYHKWTCPYSAKVRDFIQQHELDKEIQYIDRDESPGNKQKLKELSGQTQVPCLFIEGKPLLESEDIVNWLNEHLVKSSSSKASH